MVTTHLRIHGLVQGVGFRASLAAEARRRKLAGWVRNRRDGTVEALLQGPPHAVAALIAWARGGPPGARVIDLTESAAELDSTQQRFELRPTA